MKDPIIDLLDESLAQTTLDIETLKTDHNPYILEAVPVLEEIMSKIRDLRAELDLLPDFNNTKAKSISWALAEQSLELQNQIIALKLKGQKNENYLIH